MEVVRLVEGAVSKTVAALFEMSVGDSISPASACVWFAWSHLPNTGRYATAIYRQARPARYILFPCQFRKKRA